MTRLVIQYGRDILQVQNFAKESGMCNRAAMIIIEISYVTI